MDGTNESPPVTLRDIARAVGVSHTAVSLSLRNSPKITPRLRVKIQEVARRMGYQRNATATALSLYRRSSGAAPVKSCLAMLNMWPVPEEMHSYREFHSYWTGASAAAKKLGFGLEEFAVGHGMSLRRIQNILRARGIPGVLLPPHPAAPDWGNFEWEHFSVIRFGRSVPAPPVHIVTSDQTANAILAVEKIRGRGYERIGFVTGRAGRRGGLFTSGFLLAQTDPEAGPILPVFYANKQELRVNQEAFVRWLKTSRPDAILTDMAEVPAMLEKAKYRVPQDVGLAVMSILDGNADAGIDQNSEEVGRVAILLLVSLIADHERGVPPILRQVLVEGRWVDGSTLPLRRRTGRRRVDVPRRRR